MKLINKPDHDPTHPYHYHTSDGKKVVVTPEDWEKYKDDPTFREVRAAIEAEQAAYPLPEYSDKYNNYINNLADEIENQRGYNGGTNNSLISESYGKQLPQGYSRTERGLIIGPDERPLVASKFKNSPKYTVDFNNATLLTFNKGLGTERNINYYPINVNVPIYKQPLPVDRVMNVGEEREKAIDNYIKTNTTQKQRINYIPSSFAYPFLPKEFHNYSSFEKSGNDKMINIAKKAGFRRIIPNFSGHRAGGDFLIGFTDSELQNFKQRFWNKFEEDFKNDPDYDGYFWVDGDGYNKETFLDPEFGITKFNPSIGDRLDKLPQLIKDYPDKYKDFRDWYSTGPNGNSGYQTRYESEVPSRQEALKKAVITIGPLKKVGTFDTGGKLKLISK